eukprot:TRINITY_DN25809_c0_g1_i2.p1 TRINITY_DN25809_c0_g1~~TRINITY_DN25809_c0_g1_i2.p1  ORF type:complete len:277 (-),score=93.79 TRINITY_DN25809_c0_g1_i2:128-928(-)
MALCLCSAPPLLLAPSRGGHLVPVVRKRTDFHGCGHFEASASAAGFAAALLGRRLPSRSSMKLQRAAAVQEEGAALSGAGFSADFQSLDEEPEVANFRMRLRQAQSLRAKVRRELSEALEDEVWEALKVKLRPAILDELKEEFEEEVRSALREEIGAEMGVEVSAEMEEDEGEFDELEEEDDDDEDEVDEDDDGDEAQELDAAAANEIAAVMSAFPALELGLKQSVESEVCDGFRREMKREVVEELQGIFTPSVEEMLRDQLEVAV